MGTCLFPCKYLKYNLTSHTLLHLQPITHLRDQRTLHLLLFLYQFVDLFCLVKEQQTIKNIKMADNAGNLVKIRSNLTGAKEARKRAELDAQLLANRIALLKQEEEKAWRKIEETRKRSNEIMTLRDDNEGGITRSRFRSNVFGSAFIIITLCHYQYR